MKLHKRLILVIIMVSSIAAGCSKINPFVPDLEAINNHTEQETDEYIKSVDENLKRNEELIEEKAENYVDQFNQKNESVYYNALNKYRTPSNDNSNEDLITWILKKLYGGYNKFKLLSPYIFWASIAFGIIGVLFSRHNKGARRFFIVSFIITIPVLILIIVFGVGIYNDIFIYS